MRGITLSGVVCLLGIGCASSAGPPDGPRDATSCASFAPPALVDAAGLPARPDAAQAQPGGPDAGLEAAAARPELGVDLVELDGRPADTSNVPDLGADVASCPAGFRPTALACGGPGDKRFPCNGGHYDGGPGDLWCPCRTGPGLCSAGVVCCAE